LDFIFLAINATLLILRYKNKQTLVAQSLYRLNAILSKLIYRLPSAAPPAGKAVHMQNHRHWFRSRQARGHHAVAGSAAAHFFGGLIADGRSGKELLVEDLGCLEMAGGWAQWPGGKIGDRMKGGWVELDSFCPAITDWASRVGPAAWLNPRPLCTASCSHAMAASISTPV
jgi:hypothetical protein